MEFRELQILPNMNAKEIYTSLLPPTQSIRDRIIEFAQEILSEDDQRLAKKGRTEPPSFSIEAQERKKLVKVFKPRLYAFFEDMVALEYEKELGTMDFDNQWAVDSVI